MNPTLYIPEILQYICSWSNVRDLTSISCCSKYFYHSLSHEEMVRAVMVSLKRTSTSLDIVFKGYPDICGLILSEARLRLSMNPRLNYVTYPQYLELALNLEESKLAAPYSKSELLLSILESSEHSNICLYIVKYCLDLLNPFTDLIRQRLIEALLRYILCDLRKYQIVLITAWRMGFISSKDIASAFYQLDTESRDDWVLLSLYVFGNGILNKDGDKINPLDGFSELIIKNVLTTSGRNAAEILLTDERSFVEEGENWLHEMNEGICINRYRKYHDPKTYITAYKYTLYTKRDGYHWYISYDDQRVLQGFRSHLQWRKLKMKTFVWDNQSRVEVRI